MMAYSAACLTCFTSASIASVARSIKPGFDGAKDRNASRSIPSCSAMAKKASRSFRNDALPRCPPKSSDRTAQRKSSSVNPLTSPSASVSGGRSRYAICHHLTFVGFSQRNDSPVLLSAHVDTDKKPRSKPSISNYSDLTVIVTNVDEIKTNTPIQMHRLRQRNPMFRTVGRILRLIPFNIHRSQITARMVNTPLTGGQA